MARATVEDYLDWGELLLGLDADLVCFVDPEIAPAIESARRRRGRGERTRILSTPLESLRSARRGAQIARARGANPLLNANPNKDTPLYTALGWAKLELLGAAVEANPFTSTHFIWADFGLARCARARHHEEDRVFVAAPDQVRLLQLRPLDPVLLEDRHHHLSYLWGHFASGLIGGSADALATFTAESERMAEQALSDGYAASDEQLLELLVNARPELFSFCHGDYDHIIENWQRPRGSSQNLSFQLRCLRDRSQWRQAAALATDILDSIRDGRFEADSAALANLLDECFLALYYAHPDDRRPARLAALLYAEVVRREAGARDTFLLDEIRIRTNLAFVDVSV